MKKAAPEERFEHLLSMASASYAEGDATSALRYADEAELIRRTPELLHVRALALNLKRRPLQALEAARKAVEMNPKYSDANNTLGRLLLDAGRFSEAEHPLKSAAEDLVYADSFKPKTNLGILYYRKGENARAEEMFEQAIESSPLRACHAHYYRGHIELKRKSYGGAIRSYGKATQKYCGGFLDAHLALAIAYEHNREFEKARIKYLDLAKTNPGTDVAEKATERLRYLP